jgi:hypothetical protein
MSNDEQFVKIDYLTLEVGDPVYYWLYGASYELLGKVVEISDKYVFIDNKIDTETYSFSGIEQFYTLKKNFYDYPRKGGSVESKPTKEAFPKKVLTNEEIYEMLTSDVALLGLSKKAVRKIEKAVLAKVYKGESK